MKVIYLINKYKKNNIYKKNYNIIIFNIYIFLNYFFYFLKKDFKVLIIFFNYFNNRNINNINKIFKNYYIKY